MTWWPNIQEKVTLPPPPIVRKHAKVYRTNAIVKRNRDLIKNSNLYMI